MTGLGITVLMCTLASPEHCQTREMSFAEVPVTPWTCMHSQVEIAKMMEGHPEKYVKRWTCHKLEDTKHDI